MLKTLISDQQGKGEQLAFGIYFLRTGMDGKPQKAQRLVLAKEQDSLVLPRSKSLQDVINQPLAQHIIQDITH